MVTAVDNLFSLLKDGIIRNALDKRDGYTSVERKRIYDLISEAVSHPSYTGIALTVTGPENMAQVGRSSTRRI